MEKKARFTVIDLIIILVVLAAIVFGAVKVVPGILTSGEKAKVEFTVLVSGKEEGFHEAMKAGDHVTLSLTEKDGGVIRDIRTEPATTMVFDSINGKYEMQTLGGKEDIYITIEADAKISDVAVQTGSTQIRVGAELPVRGKGYATSGFVVIMNEE
jgi:hypothetical protein